MDRTLQSLISLISPPTLCALALLGVIGGPSGLQADEVIARPEWAIGDWWILGKYRYTVVARDGDALGGNCGGGRVARAGRARASGAHLTLRERPTHRNKGTEAVVARDPPAPVEERYAVAVDALAVRLHVGDFAAARRVTLEFEARVEEMRQP